MKRVLMVAVAFALLALVAVVPAASAAPEYEARVEDPTVPLTIMGTNYAVGTSITITTKVTNTGTAIFGADVCHAVFIFPAPTAPGGVYVTYGWTLSGLPPGQTVNLTGPAIKLDYAGHFEVLAVVLRDSKPADGIFTYPDELISNEAEDSFDVGTASDYDASVEIVSITAGALGGLAAIGGALVGVRFF